MANFKTHVSFSSAAGVVYGTGVWLLGVPAPTSAVAGGICAMSGMFPDIDSKTSRALQETLCLLSGLLCMLVLTRLKEFELNGDLILVIGVATFVLTKYLIGEVVTHSTVHRGMIHSIPAALVGGELAFLLSSGPTGYRAIKAIGLVIGFLSHLLLDEIYSVDVRGIRLKKSFGTALKFVSTEKPMHTAFAYLLLFGFGYLALNEQTWGLKFASEAERIAGAGVKALEKYSHEAYSNTTAQQDHEWEQTYQWFLAASTFIHTGTSSAKPEIEEENEIAIEERPSSVARKSFSREPVSRNAYTATDPYQPSTNTPWGSVPSPRNTSGPAFKGSIFKSRPDSPTHRP